MHDLYEVLGLNARATQDQLKAAFHRLAKASQPDLNADDATAEKRFRVINHAYEILSNPGSRAAYDLGLEHMRAKGHRAMWRAIGSMAASFLLTIGGGLYFWHAGRQLAKSHAPMEVSDNHKRHKQNGARQLAKDVVEVGSKTFSDIVPPASDTAMSRGKSADSQPNTSPAAEPKPTNVPVPEQEQTEIETRPNKIDETASPKGPTPGRQVECARASHVFPGPGAGPGGPGSPGTPGDGEDTGPGIGPGPGLGPGPDPGSVLARPFPKVTRIKRHSVFM